MNNEYRWKLCFFFKFWLWNFCGFVVLNVQSSSFLLVTSFCYFSFYRNFLFCFLDVDSPTHLLMRSAFLICYRSFFFLSLRGSCMTCLWVFWFASCFLVFRYFCYFFLLCLTQNDDASFLFSWELRRQDPRCKNELDVVLMVDWQTDLSLAVVTLHREDVLLYIYIQNQNLYSIELFVHLSGTCLYTLKNLI